MSESTAALRHSSLCRQLALLARGDISAVEITRAYLDAISAENEQRRAFLHVDSEGALRAAEASDARRRSGRALGRLDGIPLAIKDNLDVQGMPTSAGLISRRQFIASRDATAVSRLRGAGAVLLGKTSLDEASLGTSGSNGHFGDVPNPIDPRLMAGGSSAGSAVAVAAGLASAAIGSDTMGSIRIPAAFCGAYGLRPTLGEVSTAGLWPALPRLDVIGPLARSLDDITPLLQVMSGYDPNDPRTRRRRVPLAIPDWEPGSLRTGVVVDLDAIGASDAASQSFAKAVATCAAALSQRTDVRLADYEVAQARRAALLMMEAGMASAPTSDLEGASPRLQRMLDFARSKSAVDYARADRRLDSAVVATRRLFETVDVLLLPTVPQAPPALGSEDPANLADFTAFASLAGCPGLNIPLQNGLGLQLVGAPGSDLRLLELGEVLCSLTGCGD